MQRTLTTFLLALLALSPIAVAAQDAPTPAGGVAAELAKVNATLKEIAALLGRQSDMQGVDLLMKRVQLSDGQVAELERRLRSHQDERRQLESERTNTELQLRFLGTRLEQIEQGKSSESPDDLKAMLVQLEGGLKRTRQRISQLNQEIAVLEGELSNRREELRSWQSTLDRRLARQGG